MAQDYDRNLHERLNSSFKRMKYDYESTDNKLYFIKPSIDVCACCDESIKLLLTRLGYNARCGSLLSVLYKLHDQNNAEIESIIRSDLKNSEVAPKDIDGIIDLCINRIEDLTIGRVLLNKCITHLKTKNITDHSLWEFILYGLKFKINSGYDYLIMSYLDTYGITEHGSDINRSWLSDKNMPLLLKRTSGVRGANAAKPQGYFCFAKVGQKGLKGASPPSAPPL